MKVLSEQGNLLVVDHIPTSLSVGGLIGCNHPIHGWTEYNIVYIDRRANEIGVEDANG